MIIQHQVLATSDHVSYGLGGTAFGHQVTLMSSDPPSLVFEHCVVGLDPHLPSQRVPPTDVGGTIG